MQEQVDVFSGPGAVLSPQGLPPGTWVGRWRVECRVGSGGNGTVYEVRRTPEGRSHALKLAHVPGDLRFARESASLRRVRHAGVVRLVEEGVWQAGPVHYPYLVLEYVRGESLYDWALARNPTARQVAELLEQVAGTLAEAHHRGVLHRDFKGDNTRVVDGRRVKVLDWGAAWYAGAAPLTSAARLPPGTPPYHSPQALLFSVRTQRGRASGPYPYTVADELYAVGVTFYRLLVERYLPLRLSEDPGTRVEEPGPWAVRLLNPRVPASLAGLVHRLLAFHPEARPPGARALAESVRRALDEAGPDWDEPLFDWYTGPAPDTCTTREGGAAKGPVAPGQEAALRLARIRALGRAQQHREARLARRRELARVVTFPATLPAGQERRTWNPWVRRLTLAACALAAVGMGRGLMERSRTPEPARGGRQLARPVGPTDTSALAAASLFLPPRPPWPEEAMPITEPRQSCPTRLQRHLMAASAAISLTACSGAEVRPDSARCPSEALAAMRELRLVMGHSFYVTLDVEKPRGPEATDYNVPVRDGPIASRVEESPGRLPTGSLLYGRLWTGGEKVIGRYTRARTPDGREYPVCLILARGDGQPKSPGSQPGYTLLRPEPFVTVVDRFP
jgi:hypothetical protein